MAKSHFSLEMCIITRENLVLTQTTKHLIITNLDYIGYLIAFMTTIEYTFAVDKCKRAPYVTISVTIITYYKQNMKQASISRAKQENS